MSNIIYTDGKDPTLTKYLKEISKYKIYSQDEIRQFIVEAQKGNLKARDIIIKSHLRFVVSLAKKWQGRGVPLLDLISEGSMGLIHAIDKYDLNREVPFINYAAHWIKQYLYQTVYWTGREIRLPVSQQLKVIKICKASNEFIKTHGRNPTSIEIAAITGLSEKDINYLSQFSNKVISTDDHLGGDSENNQVGDVIPDQEPLLDEKINKEYLYNEIERLFNKLSIREHDVICLLFGLGVPPMDTKTVGDLYGIGAERVRQIKDNAFKKLKNRFDKKLIELFK